MLTTIPTHILTFSSPQPPTNSITAILVSRFMLELQEANLVTIRVNSNDPLHFSRSSTPSFIQSQFGAAINPNLEPHDLDEDLRWDLEIEEGVHSEPEGSAVEENAAEENAVEENTAEENATHGISEVRIAGPSSQV